nr:hypothetical protein [Marivita geojedonensis]
MSLHCQDQSPADLYLPIGQGDQAEFDQGHQRDYQDLDLYLFQDPPGLDLCHFLVRRSALSVHFDPGKYRSEARAAAQVARAAAQVARAAAQVVPDAAQVVPDAAQVVPDAAQVVPDAAQVVPDAAQVVPDAAQVVPDAAQVVPDAAQVVPDAVQVAARPRLQVEAPAAAVPDFEMALAPGVSAPLAEYEPGGSGRRRTGC